MQVNAKVGDPLMFLCTKVGEPLHQSRCNSAMGIDLHWGITDFGGEELYRQPFVRDCPLFASSYDNLLAVLDVEART